MWTRCSGTLPRQRNRTWFPNHFVPLVQQDIQEVEILTDSPSPQAPQSNIHTPPQKLGRECDESTSVPLTTPLMTSSPCFDNNPDLARKHDDTNVTKSPTETSSLSDSLDSQSSVRKDEKKKPSFKPQPVNSLLMEDTQQSYVSLSQDLSSGKQFQAVHHDNKQQSTNKLNGRFLDVQSLCELLQHELSVMPSIPKGVKEDVYFVLENSNNISKRMRGEISNFEDDCGVWNSKVSSTKKTVFHHVDGKFKVIEMKNGKYCTKIRKDWVPLEPQPLEDELMIMKRFYTSLKRKPDYKKRITWIEKMSSQMNVACHGKAVAEYLGVFPLTTSMHGNSKKR